jgi:hypothetical protein
LKGTEMDGGNEIKKRIEMEGTNGLKIWLKTN